MRSRTIMKQRKELESKMEGLDKQIKTLKTLLDTDQPLHINHKPKSYR